MTRLLPLPLLLLAVAAAAQDPEKEGQRPARTLERQREAAAAAEQARELGEGAEPSFEEVLKRPDDPGVNYRFALGQVRRGNLKGAAATLERLLLVNPNQPRVRLLYGLVLFRLDNLPEARRELEKVIAQNPPAAVRDEAERYLKEVKRRSKKTQLAGRLGLGVQYDSNRNAAPSAGRMLFLDLPVALPREGRRRDDHAVVMLGGLEARRDLGFQAGHEALLNAGLYHSEQNSLRSLNLGAYSVQAGGLIKTPWAELTPAFVFDYVSLDQQKFLRNHGGAARLARRVSRATTLYAEFRNVYQQYYPTRRIGAAGERTGLQWELGGGVLHALGPQMSVGAGYNYVDKDAHREYFSFKRHELLLSHSWLLGRGMFLLTSFVLHEDEYDAPDAAVSRRLRRDTTFRPGATLGAPLAGIHPAFKDLVATLNFEYYKALSNIPNYEYSNNKLLFLLTYRWSTGL